MPGKAKKTSPQKTVWKQVKAKNRNLDVDRIVRGKGFDVPHVLGPGVEPARKFFVFRWPGDQIEGMLGPSIVNIRRNSSYPIKLTSKIAGSDFYKVGDVVEFFGNKMLHEVIRDNELIGACVRIIYVGRQFLPGYGKWRKVYRVYKPEGFEEIEQLPGE